MYVKCLAEYLAPSQSFIYQKMKFSSLGKRGTHVGVGNNHSGFKHVAFKALEKHLEPCRPKEMECRPQA